MTANNTSYTHSGDFQTTQPLHVQTESPRNPSHCILKLTSLNQGDTKTMESVPSEAIILKHFYITS